MTNNQRMRRKDVHLKSLLGTLSSAGLDIYHRTRQSEGHERRATTAATTTTGMTDVRPVERLTPARKAEMMSASAVRWTSFPSIFRGSNGGWCNEAGNGEL